MAGRHRGVHRHHADARQVPHHDPTHGELDPVLREERSPVHRLPPHVLVPVGARFAVVSDIDDTVVRSSATNALKMAWILFLNSARTRLPFEGVARFYEALRRGPEGGDRNPIFYVSSSPWNIYDVLEEATDLCMGVVHALQSISMKNA